MRRIGLSSRPAVRHTNARKSDGVPASYQASCTPGIYNQPPLAPDSERSASRKILDIRDKSFLHSLEPLHPGIIDQVYQHIPLTIPIFPYP